MAMEAGQISSVDAIAQASDPDCTPFDYIVIGSGAGGGPLAARLALNGKRVLVIEAGTDPGTGADGLAREVYDVPAYNAASTEDPQTGWDFSVRHYESDTLQRADTKYVAAMDPSSRGEAGKGGIFYPRAAALGGCTSHHAMIIIRPNDSDWDDIARFTGDQSWGSENMQGYFPKIEQCLYYTVYKGFLGTILGGVLRLVQTTATLLHPERFLNPNGHGFKGWQPTSFIDPLVIAGIARADRTFLGLLFDVIWSALTARGERSVFKRAFAHLQVVQFLDPNVRSKDIDTRARLSLISIGTNGKTRSGLREWLLEVEARHPDRLVLMTGTHVTRLIFDKSEKDVPRAIGVEVMHGEYLYRASMRNGEAKAGNVAQYFARAEIIVCGGSFNSPQLLMLSGIGDAGKLAALGIPGPRDRKGNPIAPVIDLPGVGLNLQDRYEVSVVCEMQREFSTLKGATYQPGDPNDPMRAQWLADKTGLYGTNGGALAMMLSSSVNSKCDPDIFVFGVPAAFRGYYWNWSKELLWRTKGAAEDQRDLWTWVILKAYTDNNHGTVNLRTSDPFDTPDINFRSFSEGPSGYGTDVTALCDAVRHVRDMNSKIRGMKGEIQPGAALGNHQTALEQWVQNEAWGHHACGTCRIGYEAWLPDAARLVDRKAVLDSQFRVHGVDKLRVVDASVFPRIPGYFIVTPVFMISEKAADTILADRTAYPREIERREAAAIHRRRSQIKAVDSSAPESTALPKNCIGLGLSGGGVRSGTYCLGVIQALSATHILPHVDILSTASGGGYIGGFLGRLYTRIEESTADKTGRVAAILADANSPEIWWLRRHADYLIGAGRSDVETDLAIIARNLAAVLVCMGTLLVAVLGAVRWLADAIFTRTVNDWTIGGISVSPWWPVPATVLLVGVVPIAAGYWLTPNAKSNSTYSHHGLLAWAAALACAIEATAINGLGVGAFMAIGCLLLAWFWQEAVRWGAASKKLGQEFTTLYRNRLSRALGTALLMFLATAAFIILDSLARTGSQNARVLIMAGSVLVASPLVMFLRNLVIGLIQRNAAQNSSASGGLTAGKITLAVFVFAFAALIFFSADVLMHSVFNRNHPIGTWVMAASVIFSLAIGPGINFLNLSSLQQSLTQKVTRTFLGASHDARLHTTGIDPPVPIQVSEEEDDVLLDAYHPEDRGGPLHLINVCVNQTVDHISGRQLPQNKGLPMCLGPGGISVGAQYHAVWETRRAGMADDKADVRAIPVAPDPHRFHVLARSDRETATVEQLSLGRWLAISAASVSTGAGRNSSLPLSLLLGLLNVRLGYWWSSGIGPGQRPGRYPPGLWKRIKTSPSLIFKGQAMLLNEWRGYFQGPSAERWYLSDGGHFDNTGLYELIRRRLPFIIAVDGSQDEHYEMGDLAILMRQVSLDFSAELDWLDPGPSVPGAPWKGLDDAALPGAIPSWIKTMIANPDTIGSLANLKQNGPACAALARISYGDRESADSWLLLVKASLAPKIPADVRNYAVTHPSFPNQPTANQFFDDDQWESYRSLGECAGRAIFQSPPVANLHPDPASKDEPATCQ